MTFQPWISLPSIDQRFTTLCLHWFSKVIGLAVSHVITQTPLGVCAAVGNNWTGLRAKLTFHDCWKKTRLALFNSHSIGFGDLGLILHNKIQ